MKKFLMFSALIVFLISTPIALSGCVGREYWYDFAELVAIVERIEIIYLDDNNHIYSDIENQEFEVLRVIEGDEMEEFFYELSNVRFRFVGGGGRTIVGFVVVLHFPNGYSRYIGFLRTSVFNSQGLRTDSIIKTPRMNYWQALINAFVDTTANDNWVW